MVCECDVYVSEFEPNEVKNGLIQEVLGPPAPRDFPFEFNYSVKKPSNEN